MPTNVMVAAGAIETRLRFFPSTLPATDDADMTVDPPFFLRGLLTFAVQDSSQVRGQDALVSVQINDHRGIAASPNLLGNYDFSFNGSGSTRRLTLSLTSSNSSSRWMPT